MKKLFTIFLVSIIVIACQEENELEGLELSNPNDIQEADYLSLVNIREQGCNVITVDVEIKSQNIPEGLDYDFVIIENTISNKSRLTREYKDIYLSIPCNRIIQYQLYLYNSKTERTSVPSNFTYNP